MSVLDIFFKRFNINPTYTTTYSEAPCAYSGVGVEYITETHKRTISLFQERALENIIIDRYGSLGYSKFDGQWMCECDFHWESYRYDGSGKTQQDALLSLCMDVAGYIIEEIQELFRDGN